MQSNSTSMVVESFVRAGSNLQSAQLVSDQAAGCCTLWKEVRTHFNSSLERSQEQQHLTPKETMNTCTLLWSEAGRSDPTGWKCFLMHSASGQAHLDEPSTLVTSWHANLWNCFPDMGGRKKNPPKPTKNKTLKVSEKQFPYIVIINQCHTVLITVPVHEVVIVMSTVHP